MVRVAAEKRDTIPDTTLSLWWDTVSRLNWSKPMFDSQVEKLKRAKIYGAIKIEDILNPQVEENIYSQADLEREVKAGIQRAIQKGEKILKDKEARLTVKVPEIDKGAVILAVIKRLKYYHRVETENIANDVIEETFWRVIDENGLRTYFPEREGAGTRLRKKFNF